MAQHDYDIGNANGANFRSDLNNVLDAVHSTNSGSSEPSTTVAYMLWADSTNNLLKVRNGANNAWISLGSINSANLGLAPIASPTFTGTVSAPELDLTGTTSLKLPVGTTAQRPTGATGDLRFNSTLSQVETYSGSEWEKVGGVPTGSITAFGASSPPSGWLECNGAAISRSTYATLFSAISTSFGAGDGSSTFLLPDLRGEFIRGWDNSRGVDSGRAFASAQSSQMQQHNHSVNITDPGHTHNVRVGTSGSGGGNVSDRDSANPGNYVGNQIQSNTTGISASATNTGGTDNSSENRPRSIALVYIIKF